MWRRLETEEEEEAREEEKCKAKVKEMRKEDEKCVGGGGGGGKRKPEKGEVAEGGDERRTRGKVKRCEGREAVLNEGKEDEVA